jgi:hypothetical protein
MSVSVRLSPIGNPQQFFDPKGNILAGGKISTYLAGTTTPQVTYADSLGNTPNPLTVTMDSTGRPTVPLWLQSGVNYKFMVKDSNDVVLATYDNVAGINDVQTGSTIPTGSVMLFQQPSAPTTWTRISTFDDAAIRVVGNAVPASGGTNGFSTKLVPQISVDSHVLTAAEIPTHTHDMSFNAGSGSTNSQVNLFQATGGNALAFGFSNVGNGAGHNHTLTLGLKFVDIILCSKN